MSRPAVSSARNRRPLTNMTPMIDVVFQLIIFFMLAAQFSRQQTIELDLPRIGAQASSPIDSEGRAVINVIPTGNQPDTSAGTYRFGSLVFDATETDIAKLAEALRAARDRNEGVHALIRASRAEPYERIAPAMRAAQISGIREIELVVAPDSGAGQ